MTKKLSLIELNKHKLTTTPGVYFFLGRKGRSGVRGRRVLYIGKAGSLRDRIRSYFSRGISISRGAAIEKMIAEAEDIHFQKTDSVLEALILEAELIKKYKPKYNVREKDDRSFNYVIITDEDFPRVLLVRGRELVQGKLRGEIKYQFGPFPHGGSLRDALAIVRKIFPFRDKCTPAYIQHQHPHKHKHKNQHKRKHITPHNKHTHKLENVSVLLDGKGNLRTSFTAPLAKPCFNRQVGLCPGVCTGEVSKKEYKKTIRNIRLLFQGKKNALIQKLTREMKQAAKKHGFERAAQLRNTIFSLKHIQDIALLKNDAIDTTRLRSASSPRQVRIEAYDVAHMAGREIVGVMVVVEEGMIKKSDYRRFKLRTIKTPDDTRALKEILERRLAHHEWPLPDVIVVDGGKAQVSSAKRVLRTRRLRLAIVGVVKDERHRPKKILGDKKIVREHEKEILLANSEAHRFAISFHRKRMRKRIKM